MTDAAATENPEIPAAYKNKGDLTSGEVKDHLTRLSVPMMWGIGAIISFQLVDMFYIGMLGTVPLAAVSFTFPVTFAIFSIIMGFGISMSSVVSRLIGEGSHEVKQRVTTQGLLFVLLIGIFLSVAGYLTMRPLFALMGAPSDLSPLIYDYMSIWYAGLMFLALPMVGNAAIRASGDTFTPAMIMTVVALINVILDPLLIFGLFGFPRLEVQGAAIATVISYALGMAAGIYVLYVKKKLICTKYLKDLSNFGNSVKRLLIIALPAGLTNAIQPVVNGFIVALLAESGAEAVAAYGVVSRVEAFAFIVIMGVAVGMGPIIGQNWGAKKYDRVNETLRLAISFSVIWSLLVAVILGVFAKPVAAVFSADENVIQYAALFFWIVPITYMFSNLVNGWASAFNAMGMPQRSFIMIVVKMLILMLPAVYIGHMFYGVTGLFAAMAIVNVVAGIAFHLWCRHTCKCKEQSVVNA